MPRSTSNPNTPRGLREMAKGLKQQMYFWGRDVLHPSGNLLLKQGFSKSPSQGLQGTSCYSLPFEGGMIELHGACAGWYPSEPEKGGFIYVRPMEKCFLWKGGPAPVPGEWPADSLGVIRAGLPEGGLRFIHWWIHSEQWVTNHTGKDYRDECHRVHKRLPKSRAWLRPEEIMTWLGEALASCNPAFEPASPSSSPFPNKEDHLHIGGSHCGRPKSPFPDPYG